MPLTDIAVRNAKAKTKPFKLSDGGGLFLWVQPAGGKWWRYKYRFAGRETASIYFLITISPPLL